MAPKIQNIRQKQKDFDFNKERLRTIRSLTSSKELQQICQDTKDVKKVYDNWKKQMMQLINHCFTIKNAKNTTHQKS